jgi:DNA-binding NtrC family response regulator
VLKIRKHLLFVDDEPGIRETLPIILKMHDFEVKAAATVMEAQAPRSGQSDSQV